MQVSIKIISKSDNFLLVGASRGFVLMIDCGEQLTSYGANSNLLNIDFNLRTGFASAQNERDWSIAIDGLIKGYGLQRRAVFRGEQFAPILIEHLADIRALPEVSLDSVDLIGLAFERFSDRFRNALRRPYPLPEVTISKLLHFVHPDAFWILDSRVQSVLDIMGYGRSYMGFGTFLKDLFRDVDFEEFRQFLRRKDSELIGEHPLNRFPCPFLKTLDKILWFT